MEQQIKVSVQRIVYNTSKGLAIGGYGEIFNTAYLTSDKADKSDAYRGVFYIGYKFDDEWSLNTEIELEHVDESYLEFAYIDYDPKSLDGKLGFRAGLLLLPLGIINEIHEPTTYHGVFRPWVENKLIPTSKKMVLVFTVLSWTVRLIKVVLCN